MSSLRVEYDRIEFTEMQIRRTKVNAGRLGMQAEVVNSTQTGSVYVFIQDQNNAQIAEIRLSGHAPGKGATFTHQYIGPKDECLDALAHFLCDIAEKMS